MTVVGTRFQRYRLRSSVRRIFLIPVTPKRRTRVQCERFMVINYQVHDQRAQLTVHALTVCFRKFIVASVIGTDDKTGKVNTPIRSSLADGENDIQSRAHSAGRRFMVGVICGKWRYYFIVKSCVRIRPITMSNTYLPVGFRASSRSGYPSCINIYNCIPLRFWYDFFVSSQRIFTFTTIFRSFSFFKRSPL